MKFKFLGAAAVLGVGSMLFAFTANAQELKSGYYFSTPETQAIQDDDFANPGMLWADIGKTEWNKVDGAAKKSCAACHGNAAETMKGVATKYPMYDPERKKLINLEQRINKDRTKYMKAKALKWDKDRLLGLTVYVKLQSRGMPMNVKIDGPAKPFYEKGKKFYNTRRGLLDMSCANCHVQNPGKLIRANRLSDGISTGFPAYRLKWQRVGSLHRRIKGCNKQVRAQPYKQGSDEMVNLELFLAKRGGNIPLEAPAVRM